jgi:hypothetical protein
VKHPFKQTVRKAWQAPVEEDVEPPDTAVLSWRHGFANADDGMFSIETLDSGSAGPIVQQFIGTDE